MPLGGVQVVVRWEEGDPVAALEVCIGPVQTTLQRSPTEELSKSLDRVAAKILKTGARPFELDMLVKRETRTMFIPWTSRHQTLPRTMDRTCRPQTAHYMPQSADCRPHTLDHKSQTADCRP